MRNDVFEVMKNSLNSNRMILRRLVHIICFIIKDMSMTYP